MAWLVVIAVLLDAASTLLGFKHGFGEAGLVAARMIALLGPAYFAVEGTLLYVSLGSWREQACVGATRSLSRAWGPGWRAGTT